MGTRDEKSPRDKGRRKDVVPCHLVNDQGDDALDAEERDAFAQRLRVRDRDREHDRSRRSSLGPSSSRPEGSGSSSRTSRSIHHDSHQRQEVTSDLRERSRQEYLKKREQSRLELLEAQIADEEMLFHKSALTDTERRQLEYQKEVLRIAKERKDINVDVEGYVMPEDYLTTKGKIDRKRKEQALYQRYQEPKGSVSGSGKDEKGIGGNLSELEQWEARQIARTKVKVGPQDKGTIPDADAYDFIIDETGIDFVLESTLDPATEADREAQSLLDAAERKQKSIQAVRESLPVYDYRDALLAAIEDHPVLIIEGETGSGKTTQIPQYLYEAGYSKDGRKIGCTQPRRVAAMSVAARVAEEMRVHLGREVGYSIRFEDKTSEKTVVKYMTDGMLLREFLTEPDLDGYSCIMIDEAHERTLSTDILFALIKDITRYRPDLRVLIASATMDAQKFSSYFDDAPIFKIPGRPFPVDIYYTLAPEANYLQAAVTTVLQIHASQPTGDILVFLTGQGEIEQAQELLRQARVALGRRIKDLLVCPIYANLPSDLQAQIFNPTPENARKVVLATNIAETSITIDGIVYVIDPGFQKLKTFDPHTEMESLVVTPCSRNAANQRAGRAGRVGPGKCFRLYTLWAYENELEDHTIPEIQRSNLCMVALQLMSLGINNLVEFDYIDPPSVTTVQKAIGQLYMLGALNAKGEVTKTGRRMAELPLDPKMAKALLASAKYHCSDEIATLCALLDVQSALYYRPKAEKLNAEKAHQNLVQPGGDHFTLLHIWEQWVQLEYSESWCRENYLQRRSLLRATDIREQIVRLLERIEVPLESNPNPADTSGVAKAMLAGYFSNVAQRQRGEDSYKLAKRKETVLVHPSSSLREAKPPWVMYYELVMTSEKFVRVVMEINPEWLIEVAPHEFKPSDIVDKSKQKMPKFLKKARELI